MLIWKGHGILILVFGVIGGIATAALTGMLFAATQSVFLGRLAMCAPFWGAAGAIWLYAKTMGKSTERTFLDPATHRPVVITSSHSFFFIPPVPWAVLATILACVFSVLAVVAPSSAFDFKGMLAEARDVSEFDKANHLISMDKGQEAYGNTPEAQQMAVEFAQMVKLGRRLGIQAGKKPTISLSHGKFLTYCRVNADSCAFMVHVPDLRKFSKDAKEYIADVAWTVAMDAALELKPQPKRLAVGIRGALLYDTVIEGHLVPEEEDADEGIEQRHTGGSPQKYLEAYFMPSNTALADLPRRAQADDETKTKTKTKTAGTDAPKAPAGTPAGGMPEPSSSPANMLTQAAMNPREKLDVLLKWFPTTKAGEVAGNSDEGNQIAIKYAGIVHKSVSANPALGGMTLPDPCFSAYIHLRDDTAAFFLALPAGSGLTPEAFDMIERQAWAQAAMFGAQMTPLPARIAVTTFNEGRMNLTRIGSPRNQEGMEWAVEQEVTGPQSKETLMPFLSPSSKKLMTMSIAKNLTGSVKSIMPGPRAKAAPPASPAPTPAAAPAPAPAAPLLPTPVRDWKDSTGRVMQASLERFTSPARDTGYFKRADGQGFEVPFAKLSAEDQAFIRGISEKFK
ncbi:hypothetical protein [Prosthecobacter sp.]|uniref:hypothetical protein n=1 Tax=Prosthecobacter sp. TaxID=1965333 RepID=UPI0037836974